MLQKAPEGSNSNERYFPAFDGIRAVAISMVFICHYADWNFGTYGVNIFLVLSGFLITGVLYDSRDATHRFRNFYIRRTLRIFPLYYAFWLLMLLLTPVLGIVWSRSNWLYAVYLGNYIHTFFSAQIPTHPEMLDLLAAHVPFLHLRLEHRFVISIGHFWSLCVEEQFYLVWPLVVYFVKRRRTLIQICLCMIVLVPIARIVCLLLFPSNPLAIWTSTLLRCDEFLIGGAAALLMRSRFAPRLLAAGNALLATGLAVAILGQLSGPLWHGDTFTRWQMTGQFAATDAFALGMLLIGMREHSLLARALSWSPLRTLGRVSYGFYIFHDLLHVFYLQAVFRFTEAHPSRLYTVLTPKFITMVLAFFLTLAVSLLSYTWFETPFLRLKNRWAPSRPRHTPAPAVPA